MIYRPYPIILSPLPYHHTTPHHAYHLIPITLPFYHTTPRLSPYHRNPTILPHHTTPYYAVQAGNGHVGTAQALLGYNVSVETRDNEGNTALILAARQGHAPIIEVLLKHGADAASSNTPLDCTILFIVDLLLFYLVVCVNHIHLQ